MNGEELGMYAMGTTCSMTSSVIDIERIVSAVRNKRHGDTSRHRHLEWIPAWNSGKETKKRYTRPIVIIYTRSVAFPPFFCRRQEKKEGMFEKEKVNKQYTGRRHDIQRRRTPRRTFFMKNANKSTENYSSVFLAAFLAGAFLAGFSSASIEALSSARAERSPRVVFSTFGISTCGSLV